MNYLELLSPAKNLECGIAAIDHGADAVYIGAERFGARSAAGNPLGDIAELCRYAKMYGARVYVTVNTIIYDRELAETEKLINQLYEIGVDAILVQDMGILKMNLPPISLHASTQTDNRTKEKAAWLASHGFSRAVLARELSLGEIKAIHEAVPGIELEAFVHGALCVSYSGLCYASQYCFKRSANRGECAQFCRLKFDLEDSEGRIVEHGRHLLSLKDMCRIDYIEQMAEAGVTSFKIEGRLKDIAYVKNVTAAYNQKLNEIVSRHPDRYARASAGKCKYTFRPDLRKTFNRGFTTYFLTGRTNDITSFDTPKALGEHVGHVKEIRGNSFTVAGTASFANGDGLCYISKQHGTDNVNELVGFRVNKVEGNRIYPLNMPKDLRKGTELYRNNDQAFGKILSNKSSQRKISISLTIEETAAGFTLCAIDARGLKATVHVEIEKQTAVKPQRDNIIRQLTKLGNTPFECDSIDFVPKDFNLFIPSSILADTRRQVAEKLLSVKTNANTTSNSSKTCGTTGKTHDGIISNDENANSDNLRQLNVSNRLSRNFYEEEGVTGIPDAYEIYMPEKAMLMQCRHCLRYSLGYCPKHNGKTAPWREPLYLRMSDGRRFRLQFDCKDCKMNIYACN